MRKILISNLGPILEQLSGLRSRRDVRNNLCSCRDVKYQPSIIVTIDTNAESRRLLPNHAATANGVSSKLVGDVSKSDADCR